jgi:ABC-type amino acid transport substrate-binding protein
VVTRRHFCMGLGGAAWAGSAHATRAVVCASDPWPHLLTEGAGSLPQGAFADFFTQMNRSQERFSFDLQLVPRLRVNLLFTEKQADVYPFCTLAWTEPVLGLQATRTLLRSGDVYIARRDNPAGGERIFKDLARRSIAGVRGYHYGLFNNNADARYIKQHFNAHLLTGTPAVLRFVLLGRAEVGIVPETLMVQALKDPEMRRLLIVSEQFDSRVELSHLVRRGGAISVAEMDAVTAPLAAAGVVEALQRSVSLLR